MNLSPRAEGDSNGRTVLLVTLPFTYEPRLPSRGGFKHGAPLAVAEASEMNLSLQAEGGSNAEAKIRLRVIVVFPWLRSDLRSKDRSGFKHADGSPLSHG